MLEQKSNVFASALQKKMIAVKGFFKISSPVRAKMIILLYDTKISTFFNNTESTEIYHMKLHVALPISSNKSYRDNYL